jgi:predicted metal-dependent hydrolase
VVSPAFTVRRSTRARRARVTLTEEGDVIVVLPARAHEQLAMDLVHRHARWIDRHRRRLKEASLILAMRPPLGQGRAISLRGLPHDVYVEAAPASARRTALAVEVHSPPSIVVRRSAADPRPLAQLMESFLRREARADLLDRIGVRSAEMNLNPSRITVRDQRSRWGSASRKGTLSFSWRLILAPPEILDYVVVHELAHLRWGGHGTRFWSLVRRYAPAADHHRRWLRQNETRLRHALD